MTPNQIVNKIKSHKPTNPEAVLKMCNLPLKFIGDGAYRDVYQVVGTQIIIKFTKYAHCREHSQKEYETAKTIRESKLKKHVAVKKHMPEIYHYDPDTGISIGRFYKLLPSRADAMRNRLAKKIAKSLGQIYTDIENSGNVGKDRRGTLKIIDAGFIRAK